LRGFLMPIQHQARTGLVTSDEQLRLRPWPG
jgi:hypothetical protein